MTELKTLKDLEEQDYLKMEDGEMYVSTTKLKQEAIKRAKESMKLLTVKFSGISYGSPFFVGQQTEEDMHHIGRIAEIVEFYNLTEEDLKGGNEK